MYAHAARTGTETRACLMRSGVAGCATRAGNSNPAAAAGHASRSTAAWSSPRGEALDRPAGGQAQAAGVVEGGRAGALWAAVKARAMVAALPVPFPGQIPALEQVCGDDGGEPPRREGAHDQK